MNNIRKFDENNLQGLSDAEVRERLATDGYNELPSAQKRTLFRMLLEVIREPMFLLLILCGILYLLLGDVEEALMLLGFVFIVIMITLFQERKTERALEALRDLSSPRALVIRGGHQQRIAGREVVRDDLILISEGDRVPADAVILSATNLGVDESLLTGESVPVRKKAWDGVQKITRPGGDDLPFIYSGTLVINGQGICQTIATGGQTEIGKIGKALQVMEPEATSLQQQTSKIVRDFALLGLGLCLLVVIIFGLTRGDWLHGVLAGLTLAMATLPEEFPVVLTIFMALGAWRISQRQVLTRRVPAVEMLGAATVLCTDKTGTLTLNRMTVTQLANPERLLKAQGLDEAAEFYTVDGNQISLPENLHEIVEYSILASPSDPFDPMEKAMRELGGRTLARTEHLHKDWTLMREYPLSEKLLAMSRVWQAPNGEDYVIAAKGAPEAIADLCHLDPAQLKALEKRITAMAERGLRVIGVARAKFHIESLPKEQHDFEFEFTGLLGLADPVRPGVAKALQECYDAGIRVIMITGDYPGTATNIAQRISLRPANQVITGPELDQMSDAELQERIRTTCIFARVVPEQKLRLVEALKANGEVVAMTGDGVNDAPALKAAHIGIAMGGRGTDVAREAAALVLLDDNFASIVQAVRMGRRIYDNLKKAMTFILSVHIPIAGMTLLPVIFGWPLVLLPVHIVFLELIIDPACSIVFEMEDEEKDVMSRPPRNLQEPLFDMRMLLTGLIQGTGILLVVLAAFGFFLNRGFGESEARMVSFTSLVIADLGLIFANRSRSRTILATLSTPNPALWWVSGGALSFLGLALFVPFLRRLFSFGPLHMQELPIVLVTGLVGILISESVKTRPFQSLFAKRG
ncbi:MAG: cation-translocating P-type ATPase [Anaerolineales bacterium]